MAVTMTEKGIVNPDPLTTAAKAAWLEYVNGTYSMTDRRVFVTAFIEGAKWQKRRDEGRRRHPQRGNYHGRGNR